MPDAGTKARALTTRTGALTPKQEAFLDKVHMAARLLATQHLTRQGRIEGMRDAFSDITSDHEARVWLRRGREYITRGYPEDAVEIRQDYKAQLRSFIAKCSEHMVKDKVEVTIVSSLDGKTPAPSAERDPSDPGAPAPEPAPKYVKKKAMEQVFNPAIAHVLLKAMKMLAEAEGAITPANGRVVFNQQNNNTTNLLPGRQTSGMSNEELIRRMLGPGAKLLQGTGAAGRDAAGVCAEGEGVATGDGHGAE